MLPKFQCLKLHLVLQTQFNGCYKFDTLVTEPETFSHGNTLANPFHNQFHKGLEEEEKNQPTVLQLLVGDPRSFWKFKVFTSHLQHIGINKTITKRNFTRLIYSDSSVSAFKLKCKRRMTQKDHSIVKSHLVSVLRLEKTVSWKCGCFLFLTYTNTGSYRHTPPLGHPILKQYIKPSAVGRFVTSRNKNSLAITEQVSSKQLAV